MGGHHRSDVNAENRKRENTMDTKTIIVTLVCAVLGSSALTAGEDRSV
nr:MAG TPA: hypothetical protein [Caudoviricetes sp.]